MDLAALFKPLLLKRKGLALGVWGEAGVGKSYTVQLLLTSLACHSLSLHASSSLASLVKRLPRPKKLATWAARSLERLEAGEVLETSAVVSSLSTTLTNLAPFVLHLEDIHEVEAAQLDFTQHLARALERTKGVGLLVTSRREPPEPFQAVKLEPLSERASDELLTRELRAVLPGEAGHWIYSKAAGNPLYTLEYLRYLARQGYLWNDGATWRWRQPSDGFIPVTVEALIEQQLTGAKTSALHTNVLEARAFLPLEVTREVWMNVAGVSPEELQRATEALQQDSIFRDDTFIHPLYKEVTLQMLQPSRRQHLARRMINTLRTINTLHDAPEEIARYVDDANLDKAQALGLLKNAAQHARDATKTLQAGRLLAQAVRYAQGEAKGNLALEAAKRLDGLDYPRMLELAKEASEHLAEPSEAFYLQAAALGVLGDYEAMQQSVRMIPETSKHGLAWLQRYVKLLHLTTKHQELVDFWESQRELQERADGVTLYSAAWAYIHLGNFLAVSDVLTRGLERPDFTPLDLWSLLEVKAAAAFYQGKYQEAEGFFTEALELGQKLPASATLPQDIANVLRNRSVNRLQLGRYVESLPDLHEALKIYSEVGNSIYYAQTLVMTSYVYLELGDASKTEDVLLEALDILNRTAPQPFLSHALSQLSTLYADVPNRSYLARKYALESLRVAHEVTDAGCLPLAKYALARAELNSGDPTTALGLADEALDLATRLENFEATLNARVIKGLALEKLARVSEATKEISLAVEAAGAQGMVLEANKFGLELDRINHDIQSARARMQWFEERGLLSSVNLARRYFPQFASTHEAEVSGPEVRLDVLGSMQTRVNGKTEALQGRKRQELLALLLEAKLTGRTEVTRLELFDLLYPDKDELKAGSSLKELVSALRDRLGANVIVTTPTGYALGDVKSDAELFLQTADTRLWRGRYVEDVTLENQNQLAESLYGLLYDKTQELSKTNTKEAARLARLLLEVDPYNRDFLKLLLEALRGSSNHKSLGRLYEEGKKRLLEVGERLPETWQHFLGET
jgi:tetratricopeptide (TPR) repeat protein/DNA-binding SARP family transcriptional activator